MHVCVCLGVYVCVRVCVRVCANACLYMCMCADVWMCVCACACVCLYVCMCLCACVISFFRARVLFLSHTHTHKQARCLPPLLPACPHRLSRLCDLLLSLLLSYSFSSFLPSSCSLTIVVSVFFWLSRSIYGVCAFFISRARAGASTCARARALFLSLYSSPCRIPSIPPCLSQSVPFSLLLFRFNSSSRSRSCVLSLFRLHFWLSHTLSLSCAFPLSHTHALTLSRARALCLSHAHTNTHTCSISNYLLRAYFSLSLSLSLSFLFLTHALSRYLLPLSHLRTSSMYIRTGSLLAYSSVSVPEIGIHTCTHSHTHTFIHACIHKYIRTCLYAFTHTHTHTHIHTQMYTDTPTNTDM